MSMIHQTTPSFHLELMLHQASAVSLVAGLDEAGRGAWAGPVVASAVLFSFTSPNLAQTLHRVNDSKKLTARTREQLFDLIQQHALTYAVAFVSAEQIDQIGILPATKEAMKTAVSQLTLPPQHLLIDGNFTLKNIPLPQQTIVQGDSKSLSIAAASILAKVSRDRYMIQMDNLYPSYGFAQHKGYGTAQHQATLTRHGPCPLHRLSFAPLRQSRLPL